MEDYAAITNPYLQTVPLDSMSYRAVGAGPAGPAAAGPIFGQLTRAKMPPPMSFGGLFNCYSKSSYARKDLG